MGDGKGEEFNQNTLHVGMNVKFFKKNQRCPRKTRFVEFKLQLVTNMVSRVLFASRRMA